MELRAVLPSSTNSDLIDVVVVVVVVDIRLRFLVGVGITSSMSVVCDLSSVLPTVEDDEYANLANEERVKRLGGDVVPVARSNSLDVSLDTFEVRMMSRL